MANFLTKLQTFSSPNPSSSSLRRISNIFISISSSNPHQKQNPSSPFEPTKNPVAQTSKELNRHQQAIVDKEPSCLQALEISGHPTLVLHLGPAIKKPLSSSAGRTTSSSRPTNGSTSPPPSSSLSQIGVVLNRLQQLLLLHHNLPRLL